MIRAAARSQTNAALVAFALMAVVVTRPNMAVTRSPVSVPSPKGLHVHGSMKSASELPHRYIVFVGGINSHENVGNSGGDVKLDFQYIRNRLAYAFGGTHQFLEFIYFSYAATKTLLSPCNGWDKCDYHRNPVYSSDDTKLDLNGQANALEWLVSQIVADDPRARVDVIGYSLGGVVATLWAAQPLFPIPDDVRQHVHSVVIFESPVGGIPAAHAFLAGCVAAPSGCGYALFFQGWFGTTILRELQLPVDDSTGFDSVVGLLPDARATFDFTSIESAADYLVNGQELRVCLLIHLPWCTPDRITIGRGSRFWDGALTWTKHADKALGHKTTTTRVLDVGELRKLVLDNHGAPLLDSQTAAWIVEAVNTSGPIWTRSHSSSNTSGGSGSGSGGGSGGSGGSGTGSGGSGGSSGGGSGGGSSGGSGSSSGTVPPAPTGLIASTDQFNQVTLSWNSARGATSYIIHRRDQDPRVIDTVPGDKHAYTELMPCHTGRTEEWTWYVVAVNSSGQSPPSIEATGYAAPCGTSTLTASTDQAGQVTLSWTRVRGAVRYEIHRVDQDPPPIVSPVGPDITSYVEQMPCHNGPAEEWTWYIKAFFTDTVWTESNRATGHAASCGTSTLTVSTDQMGQVTLSWTPVPGAVRYEVHRLDQDPPPIVPPFGPSTTSYVEQMPCHNGPAEEWTWYIKVFFTDTVWTQSNQAAGHAAECGASTLAVSTDQVGQVTLSWTRVPGAVRYEIHRVDQDPPPIIPPLGSDATTYTEALPCYTGTSNVWTWYIKAFFTDTVWTESNRATGHAALCPPTTPTNISVSTDQIGQVTVTWTPSQYATSYEIHRQDQDPNPIGTAPANGPNAYLETGLPCFGGPAQQWTWYVVAVNSSGRSSASAPAVGHAASCDLVAPVNVSASTDEPGQVTLTWTPVPQYASGYAIYRQDQGTNPIATIQGGGASTFVQTGLPCYSGPSQQWTWYVVPLDPSGNPNDLAQSNTATGNAAPC